MVAALSWCGTRRKLQVASYVQREISTLFHKEPECVDAVRWSGDNFTELEAEFPETNARMIKRKLAISVTGGELFLKMGWYLLRTPKGSIYAMRPDAFEARYIQSER
jgi:hypothetical protein